MVQCFLHFSRQQTNVSFNAESASTHFKAKHVCVCKCKHTHLISCQPVFFYIIKEKQELSLKTGDNVQGITRVLRTAIVLGIPWRSSGQDSMLSLPRAWVLSLVGELRSHKLYQKKKKKGRKEGGKKERNTVVQSSVEKPTWGKIPNTLYFQFCHQFG